MRLILLIILVLVTGEAVLIFNPDLAANVGYTKRRWLGEVCPPSTDSILCHLAASVVTN